ncbi:hypothetical protein HDU76_005416 [Blyttiomyces sp. JEL0837]|nr:hypothetical protein HDU76_005416 [Blyttiomyces sp. JEL0837]
MSPSTSSSSSHQIVIPSPPASPKSIMMMMLGTNETLDSYRQQQRCREEEQSGTTCRMDAEPKSPTPAVMTVEKSEPVVGCGLELEPSKEETPIKRMTKVDTMTLGASFDSILLPSFASRGLELGDQRAGFSGGFGFQPQPPRQQSELQRHHQEDQDGWFGEWIQMDKDNMTTLATPSLTTPTLDFDNDEDNERDGSCSMSDSASSIGSPVSPTISLITCRSEDVDSDVGSESFCDLPGCCGGIDDDAMRAFAFYDDENYGRNGNGNADGLYIWNNDGLFTSASASASTLASSSSPPVLSYSPCLFDSSYYPSFEQLHWQSRAYGMKSVVDPFWVEVDDGFGLHSIGVGSDDEDCGEYEEQEEAHVGNEMTRKIMIGSGVEVLRLPEWVWDDEVEGEGEGEEEQQELVEEGRDYNVDGGVMMSLDNGAVAPQSAVAVNDGATVVGSADGKLMEGVHGTDGLTSPSSDVVETLLSMALTAVMDQQQNASMGFDDLVSQATVALATALNGLAESVIPSPPAAIPYNMIPGYASLVYYEEPCGTVSPKDIMPPPRFIPGGSGIGVVGSVKRPVGRPRGVLSNSNTNANNVGAGNGSPKTFVSAKAMSSESGLCSPAGAGKPKAQGIKRRRVQELSSEGCADGSGQAMSDNAVAGDGVVAIACKASLCADGPVVKKLRLGDKEFVQPVDVVASANGELHGSENSLVSGGVEAQEDVAVVDDEETVRVNIAAKPSLSLSPGRVSVTTKDTAEALSSSSSSQPLAVAVVPRRKNSLDSDEDSGYGSPASPVPFGVESGNGGCGDDGGVKTAGCSSAAENIDSANKVSVAGMKTKVGSAKKIRSHRSAGERGEHGQYDGGEGLMDDGTDSCGPSGEPTSRESATTGGSRGSRKSTSRPPRATSRRASTSSASAGATSSSGPGTSITVITGPSSSLDEDLLAPVRNIPKSASDSRFYCPYDGCGRSFNRRFNLQAHYATHLGVRSFSCPCCGRWFSRRYDMKRHVRTHGEDVAVKVLGEMESGSGGGGVGGRGDDEDVEFDVGR